MCRDANIRLLDNKMPQGGTEDCIQISVSTLQHLPFSVKSVGDVFCEGIIVLVVEHRNQIETESLPDGGSAQGKPARLGGALIFCMGSRFVGRCQNPCVAAFNLDKMQKTRCTLR